MKISHLYVYPVKSLRGCSVPSATLTPHGLKHDRSFMLVRVVTTKSESEEKHKTSYESLYVGHIDKLCLFTTSFMPSYDNPEIIRIVYNDPQMTSSSDSQQKPHIDVPANPRFEQLNKVDLNIHQSKCQGYDIGEMYERFFTEHLGFPTKLVYVGDSTREVRGNIAPDKTYITKESAEREMAMLGRGRGGSVLAWVHGLLNYLLGWLLVLVWSRGHSTVELVKGTRTRRDEYRLLFSDCAPLLVTSQSSLEKMGVDKPGLPLDMTKTRPNIVISPSSIDEDVSAFEEDYWAEINVRCEKSDDDNLRIPLTANCGRCKSLNVDYTSGKQLPVDQHMLKRLADMKRRVDPGMGYSPVFGRYGFLHNRDIGKRLAVGDAVDVSKRNAERTVFYWPGLTPGTRPKN